MNGLIDIHSHILPLVDDGAESVEMALLMLKKAAEEGIEKSYSLLIKNQIEDVLRRKEYSVEWKNSRNWPEKKKYRCGSIRGMRFLPPWACGIAG